MSFKQDQALLSALMQLPNMDVRAAMVQQLHPDAVTRLCAHLKKIVHQARSHRISNAKSRATASSILQPYSRVVKRLTNGTRPPTISNLRKQRGGAIISLLLASVLPMLAQMAISAIIGKKKK